MLSKAFKKRVFINTIFAKIDSGVTSENTIKGVQEILQEQCQKDYIKEEVKLFMDILYRGHLYQIEDGTYCRCCEMLNHLEDFVSCKLDLFKNAFTFRRNTNV